MGIVVNLNNDDNMITVTVTTTWGYQVVEETAVMASTIEAIMAAMHATERKLDAKVEDLATRRDVRRNKAAKWRVVRNALAAAHDELADKLVDEIRQQPQAAVWVNEWYGDVTPQCLAVPADWRDIRGGVSVRSWPIAPSGSVVEHNNKQWRVVVNHVYGGRPGYYAKVFSVYAIVPA